MSGEPNSQKSGWKNHSNERIFMVSIQSVVLHVMANIAQSLIGDCERIVVANLEGFTSPPPRN